jgi:hypothetical protein
MLRTIEDAVDASLYPSVLIGCPDPHDEVWCTADLRRLREALLIEALDCRLVAEEESHADMA